MKNKNRAGGRLARMRALYARLCGGWGSRTERFDPTGVRLPNPPMQPAAMPSPEQSSANVTQRAQTVTSPIRRSGMPSGLRLRGLAGMQSSAANGGVTYGLRGLAGVQSNAANGGATYGLRGLAGVQSNAAISGVTYGLRRTVRMRSNAAISGVTYGLRRTVRMRSNVATDAATYGLRRLAGVQSNAANGGAPCEMPAPLPPLPMIRGVTGRTAPSPRGVQANAFRAASPAAENTAKGNWMQRVFWQSAGTQTAARAASRHETFGLRGLAGVSPAQQSVWSTPPALSPQIPSPLPDMRQGADAAAAQVQVHVTNNCKIETPVDYRTVWDKLEDALRESLSIVAAGG